jgi:TPP-dependent pyruvate/acetoin dehydrogenase alpha subunit
MWGLPVLFCCENNLYAMGTALKISESQPDLTTKARSYAMQAESVDGMNVVSVDRAVRRVVREMRAKPRPHFLELRTYRFRAHSMFDPQLYREKTEVEEWKAKCPIESWKGRLREAGELSDEQLAAMEKKISEAVEDSVTFAEKGTLEPIDDLLTHVLAPEAQA